MTNDKFTVVIPTYNGANKLPKLLDRLQQQTGLKNQQWEILVIDNNSHDDTAQVVKTYQDKWQGNSNLKYHLEPEQGSAFARLRGAREAKGELIGFIDDDCIPAPDWIAAACTFAAQHPQAGAFSGQIHGDFDIPPPPDLEFKKIQAFLAIREHGNNPLKFNPDTLNLPPAAALVVRQQAFINSVPPRPVLVGRVGNSMLGGEDYELLLYLHKAGWEIWYNPAMHSYHHIPQNRLEKQYLLTLAHACGLATCHLRMLNASPGQKPIIFTKTLLGNLRRWLKHYIKYRGKLDNNLIAACENEFFWGSLLSNWDYLTKDK